jgi:hypothetical protein
MTVTTETTATTATAVSALITTTLPKPFTSGWNRIDGITIDGRTLTVDPDAYFFRYESPSWILVPFEKVTADLLPAVETTQIAVEQIALDFVRKHGRSTTDPAQVLATAHEVYSWLFRPEQLDDPGVAAIASPEHLTMLREVATLMALNRVELDGHISNIGPSWFFPAAVRVVYGLSKDEGERLDDLYHGAFFNEYRRRESVLAHAALGGRLVHGCQSNPDMTGGCVVPYGASLDTFRFRAELAAFKHQWIDAVLQSA